MANESALTRVGNFLRKPATSIVLRVVVSLALLAYLAWISAFQGIVQAFGRIQPVYLLVFFLLYFLAVGMQALRWKFLLHAWGIERSFRVLYRNIMAGLFLSNFLPGSIGGDVYRLYMGGRDTGKIEAVTATIFYERLISYGSLVTLGLIVLGLRASFAADWMFWLLLGGAFLALVTLGVLPSIPAFERLARRLAERFPLAGKLRLTDWLHNFRFRPPHAAALAGIMIFSFMIQLSDVTSFRLVAAAMQLPVKVTDLLLFVPLLYLAILLPLSLNGLGVRETVFVIFASIWGIQTADAVAFSLTVFTLNLAGSLVGGVIYWFDRAAPGGEIPQARVSG